MQKNIVFLTGDKLGANVSETIHLYRRMESFKKSGNVSIITQASDLFPEKAGCKKVVHLNANGNSVDDAVQIAKQADMFVLVGIAPDVATSAALLNKTRQECCIAIINKGRIDLPKDLHREHVFKMRDMSAGTGLMFLSMYRWMMDLIEE